MNYNTPEEYGLGKHFGLFMLYSENINGTATGGQVRYNGNRPGYVKNSQFIEIQKYELYEAFIVKNCPARQTCKNFPQCNYSVLNRNVQKTDKCPKCNGELITKRYYTEAQMKQVAILTYEGSIIHEIGHCILGPGHHTNGIAKFTDTNGAVHAVSPTNLSSLTQADKEIALDILAELGVSTCAMRYNIRRDDEFITGSLLNTRINRFCRKNEKYIDDYNNLQNADNCFGKITVK
jgi:hypothetical protein